MRLPPLLCLGPRLIPCCAEAFCLVPNMTWPGFNFQPLLLGLNSPEFKWLFSNPFFLSMNAFEGCNKNHLPGLASCPFLKLCFAPGGEDTPVPLQTQLRAKHKPGAEGSAMKAFGAGCSTKPSPAVSRSLFSLTLPRTSQAFCSLTLLHTDVQSFIRASLPELPGSGLDNQTSFKTQMFRNLEKVGEGKRKAAVWSQAERAPRSLLHLKTSDLVKWIPQRGQGGQDFPCGRRKGGTWMEGQAGAVLWQLWLWSLCCHRVPRAPHPSALRLPGQIPLRGFHSAMTMLPFQKTPPSQSLYFGNFKNANCFLNKRKPQNILF